MAFVGEQREVQPLLFVELLHLRDGIRRDAEHDRAGSGVVGAMIAHAARLRRAAGVSAFG